MKKLKAFFRSSKMTQSALADMLGVHRSVVTHWMQGVNKPARDRLKKLSEITGIPVEDLL